MSSMQSYKILHNSNNLFYMISCNLIYPSRISKSNWPIFCNFKIHTTIFSSFNILPPMNMIPPFLPVNSIPPLICANVPSLPTLLFLLLISMSPYKTDQNLGRILNDIFFTTKCVMSIYHNLYLNQGWRRNYLSWCFNTISKYIQF